MSKSVTLSGAVLDDDNRRIGTGYVTVIGDDIVVGTNKSTFSTSELISTVTCKYAVYNRTYKKEGQILDSFFNLGYNGALFVRYTYADYVNGTYTAPNISRTCTILNQVQATYNASDYFNLSNPNDKEIALTYTIMGQPSKSYVAIDYKPVEDVGLQSGEWNLTTGTTVNLGQKLVLDAPPTFNTTQVSFDTNGAYAKLTTASVTVSNLSAKYGGNISSVVLTIGGQTATRSSNGTLSIKLDTIGTFTPTVTVTDSRGQVTTEALNDITVKSYECSVARLAVSRINSSTFKLDDEGTNAVLQATFTFSEFSGSTLTAPTVKVNGTEVNTNNITWYTSWDTNSGFSGVVSNWNSISSDTILYAKIIKTFYTNESYTISIIPKTTINTTGGAEMSAVLPQAFYLLVGRPGGHGLGIGMKPPGDNLYIDMDILLNTSNERTADINLLSAIHSLNWDSGSSTVIE